MSGIYGQALRRSTAASAVGAELIGSMSAAPGAKATTLSEVASRKPIHLFDFLTAAQKSDVLAGNANSAVAVTTAMNQAIAAASAARCWLELPPCTIYVTPNTPKLDETGTMNTCAFPMRSNMFIVGQPGTVLKITDGVSSDAAPKLHSMFFTNEVLSDIALVGLTLDMNGAANPMSPGRPATYNLFTQAAVLCSGTPGGVAAGASNVHIERCRFVGTAGVTCIGMAQTNSAGITLQRNWRILNCEFWNNGSDTVDHSSIYAWAEDVVIQGCRFGADVMWGTVGRTGPLVAIEIHGARQSVVDCSIVNHYQGLWLATNRSQPTTQVLIANNRIGPVRGIGIDTYRESAEETVISQVLITGNTITLTDDPTVITLKAAIQIVPSYTVTDIMVANNIGIKTGTAVGSVFFSTGPQAVAGQRHDRITCSDNKAVGFTIGAFISTNATNGYGSLVISENEFHGLAAAGAFNVPIGISGANISAANAVDHLELRGNTIRGTTTQYGIYLSGAINHLHAGPNSFLGMTVADHYEIALTVGGRHGYFDNVAWTPVWDAGTAITLGNGSVRGAYSMSGDMVTISARITIGSTTVLPGGSLRVSLPFPASDSGAQYLGQWRVFDASTNNFVHGLAEADGTASVATLQLSGGTYATHAAPVALAVGDVISVQLTYRRA